jgi:hypothetical protein
MLILLRKISKDLDIISDMGLFRGVRDFTPVCKSIHPEAAGRRVY